MTIRFFGGLLLTCALVAAPAHAQELRSTQANKTVTCYPMQEFFSKITEKLGVAPSFAGRDHEGSMVVVLHNPTTNFYAVVEFNAQIACVLTHGEGQWIQPSDQPPPLPGISVKQ
jgi:hypothetical protein